MQKNHAGFGKKISLKSVLKLEECLEDQGNPVPTGKEQDQRKD
jgi:hypothetical protein